MRLALLAAAILLSACSDPTPPPPVGPATFESGRLDGKGNLKLNKEAFTQLLAGDFPGGLSVHHRQSERGELTIAVADLAQFHAGVVAIGATYPTGVTIENVMQDEGVQLLVGSGFVTELNALTPVGLLQVDEVVVSKIQRHGYTRVLGIDDHRVGVVDHLNFERGLFPSALQAGPGVVEQGVLDILPRDLQRTPYFRALVGACGDHAFFAASMVPMHLYSAGEMLLEFAAEQELPCDEVVNLAGDREALLAVRGAEGDVLYIGNPRTSKASMVVLRSLTR